MLRGILPDRFRNIYQVFIEIGVICEIGGLKKRLNRTEKAGCLTIPVFKKRLESFHD